MNRTLVQTAEVFSGKDRHDAMGSWQLALRGRPIDRWALGLAFCAVPVSIAIAESLLFVALATHIVRCARGHAQVWFPRIFFFWSAWAGLEILSWLLSPERGRGWGEMRHLLLIAAVFFLMPTLSSEADRQLGWRGIFVTSTLGSLFLLGDFVARFVSYRSVLATSDEVSIFLRSGGLLNHWMVYGTVEIMVVAGLLSFWSLYPEERRRWWPVAAINGLAILLSLTRMVWISCFVLVGIELAWRRSKWFWALPLLPVALYVVVPSPVRLRVQQSFRPDFYSNVERVEMLRVGWRMIKEKPLTGVGPGRIDGLYQSYLTAGEPLPAYHGHLHNNLIQLAAEFGLPTLVAAFLMLAVLFRDLLQASKAAVTREARFSCRAGILALVGFLIAGVFDYTYGHSLGLILLCFAVLSPLLPVAEIHASPAP